MIFKEHLWFLVVGTGLLRTKNDLQKEMLNLQKSPFVFFLGNIGVIII